MMSQGCESIGKKLMNILLMGHVDSGKSTLIGRLMHESGMLSKQKIHRHKTDSQNAGKGSFYLAWSVDETVEERDKGITTDIATVHFETEKWDVVFIDSPGHKDFVPKMVQGASQADAVILVVDCSAQRFETAMDKKSHSYEHLILAQCFGLSQIIVAVNKMDMVEWSEQRFIQIKQKVNQILCGCGYKEGSVQTVPISALMNLNLLQKGKSIPDFPWLKSVPSLFECINRLPSPSRDENCPLRLSVSCVHKDVGCSDPKISGLVATGSVSVKNKVFLMPQKIVLEVKKIFINNREVLTAPCGSHTELQLSGQKLESIKIGNLLCCQNNPSLSSKMFVAKLHVLNTKSPIVPGSCAEFYSMQIETSFTFHSLLSSTVKKTQTIKSPRLLTAGTVAMVILMFDEEIPFDLYQTNKKTGRFVIRDCGITIGFGIITGTYEVNE